MDNIKKVFNATVKSVNDDRTVIFRASDETPDRDGDVIKAEGWELDNFIKSGSILYGHNPSRFPVASVKDAFVQGKELMVMAQFPEEGKAPDSDVAYNLIKSDVLKGVSVGFIGKEWEENKDTYGRTFTKAELLELSLTPVPANANAMAIVKEYDPEHKDKYIETEYVTKEEVEQMIKDHLTQSPDNEVLEDKEENDETENELYDFWHTINKSLRGGQ